MSLLEKTQDYLKIKKNESIRVFLKLVESGELSVMILTFMLFISMFTSDLFGPDILYPIFTIIIWKNVTQLEPLKKQVDNLLILNEDFSAQINSQIKENNKLSKNIDELENVKNAINEIATDNNEDLKTCISKISSQAELLKKNVLELKKQNLEYKEQNDRHQNFLDRHKPQPSLSSDPESVISYLSD